MIPEIYTPQVVLGIELFYGKLLTDYDQFPNVKDHLAQLAQRLHEGLQNKVRPLYSELNNYNQSFIGRSVEELMTIKISQQDCYETIAQEYGFESWDKLSQRKEIRYHLPFERAVNLLLAGNVSKLKSCLVNNQDLVRLRSPYGHSATLLHYVGSNGVEFWRQKVPLNLGEITTLLLKQGADPKATMSVYGGQFTTLELLTTSAHPYKAGVAEQVVMALS